MFRIASLLALALFAAPALAQTYETPPAPKDEPRPVGYLPKDAISFWSLLGEGPPSVGSAKEAVDIGRVAAAQRDVTPERWQVAEQDNAWLYARFADAFGVTIDRATLPRTVHLLNRAMRDTANVSSPAKAHFQRVRPYQRAQVARLCGKEMAPPPDPAPARRTSFPSGHTAVGWTTALILADIAPQRVPRLFERARDYGESRVICAYHFPSDVAAGKRIALTVVDRLQQDAAFRADLACATAEYRNVTRGEAMPRGCSSATE
jgi:acid phosphatase (class A)